MRNIADITIHPSPDKELYNWLGDLQNGKIIKWMNRGNMVLQESNADCYYLIGNADAQSFFYQFNRNLPFFQYGQQFCLQQRHTGEFFFRMWMEVIHSTISYIYPYSRKNWIFSK